ncbi:efflux RND transporter permease subunit [Candidimonas sp. SYP-B2681]|uniref:efflux RND transporter permease subunit n=1 Tax=Candidimonas sp. SYP-B2681 TaxID=2497686 RepID=UPI000F86BB3C|nr:efflux RND transporter permease subunit [Candidimonas sp. SYP-B2681]RTZ47959.1 efflux RND transporter permease subunit [Candidimonas sp. SYP-B2681]
MSRFFIDRPIFAWVIALVIMLAGGLSIMSLPVAQYPAIAPPQVSITANYPGSSAQTLQDTVTQVIEQQMKGIDGMDYMSSTSDSSGRMALTITFKAGTDPDIAQVQVQNKLAIATPMLPQEVQRQGVQVTKSTANFLMVVGLISQDGSMSATDLGDYAVANLRDPMSRVEGVGELEVFGSQYAMRIWLDPNKLFSYNLVPGDIVNAVRAQNAQVSAGQLGATPSVPGQQLNATITSQTLLQTPEEFGAILLRSTPEGAAVRLRDVAQIEMGSEGYNIVARYNGLPTAGLGFKLATGANALDTAEAIKAQVKTMESSFPSGMKAVIAFDTTPFVEVSISGVVTTLIEAVILVFLVMYLFLQNFRATLIPTIAIPVVLLGTFGILSAFGFSINTLTLFGVVLAIGLLVDDAIVVVENVERLMTEEGLSPIEATRKSMDQITGALVGIGMVISAVLIPMAFFGGSTGVIYRQFSITIVSAMGLSVLVAIILTPALCATMLKPIAKGQHAKRGRFFTWFNQAFDRSNNKYQGIVGGMLAHSTRYLLIYAALVAVTVLMFVRMPTSFLPDEDQGVLFTQVLLPAGATQERTLAALDKMEAHFMENEKDNVESVFTVAGFSFAGAGQNAGLGFVKLTPWDERPGEENGVAAIAGRAMGALSQIKDAMVFAFAPPAVMELGNAGGFDSYLQDRSSAGHEKLTEARNQLLGLAAQHPGLSAVRPNGQDDTPQYRIEIDQAKAGALGLSMDQINSTLSTAWGGSYVNDFIDGGRIKKVYVQSEAASRMVPEDLKKWYARNTEGEMVPFSAFSSAYWSSGSPRLERYNGIPAVQIQGAPAPGVSSGDAMAAMEEIAAQLPPGFGIEWTGQSYQERMSGSQAPALYAISLIVVFLCLAALYESWSIPFAVMLVVPLGILGALVAASTRGMSNDVYFQVGLLVTIGLAAKNAIMIVEFARDLMNDGMGVVDAALKAAKLRLRPILMTSIAFGLGVLPLAISTGAGSGSKNAIGTGVLGGTIAATFLGIFFIPLFFVAVRKLVSRKKPDTSAKPPIATQPDEA